MSGQFKGPGICFSCGKAGHWRSECPLAPKPDGKKLSGLEMNLSSDVMCVVDSRNEGEWGGDAEELFGKGDFLESEYLSVNHVRGRLGKHLHAWHEIEATEPVLSIRNEDYKLPLLTIPPSVTLRNNKSALDNLTFVSKAINDLLSGQCISITDSQPWVVNPLSVSVRDDGKKRCIRVLSRSLESNPVQQPVPYLPVRRSGGQHAH